MPAVQDRPDYKHCAEVAQKVADLLSPQSGAYYDVWLDGEKFMSRTIEVQSRPSSAAACAVKMRHLPAVLLHSQPAC